MKISTAIGMAFLLLFASAGGVFAHSLASFQAKLSEDEPGFAAADQPAPGFELVDRTGKIVRNESLLGKVVVLFFVCTRCPDQAPRQMQAMARVQEMINISAMRDLVQFIGIVSDVAGQKNDGFWNYGDEFGLDGVNWMLLAGDGADGGADEIWQLAQSFGHKVQQGDDGFAVENIVTHIIGIEGRWRGDFNGLDFNPTNLIIFINALTNIASSENDGHADESEPQPGFWSNILGIVGIGN